MKLPLALLLLCGVVAVIAAPEDGDSSTKSSATPVPSSPVSVPLSKISGQLADVSTKVSQLSGGMSNAATQLNKLAHVDTMLKEDARRRKLRWREKYAPKASKWSDRKGKSEDQFGAWKNRQFPEDGKPEASDNGKDAKSSGNEQADTKMLMDVINKAKEASPLADHMTDELQKDLKSMAASLTGYDKQVQQVNKKLEDATSIAAKKARKEQAMEKLHGAMMDSKSKIKELHSRAKQLAAIEKQHKKNLRKKLKRLAQMHRKHLQKLIYQSRLKAMKIWMQHRRRQRLAHLMTNLKVTQMYQQHKKATQAAMNKSAKKLWQSFVKALQGHKGLKDESRKAMESIERIHRRRMSLLKQEHQRKKLQIKSYVRRKYADIMRKHYSDVADIRRKRQATMKALADEINRNRWQKRRLERIVTDQESPDLTPEWERELRDRADRTRRLHKLYRAIMEQKRLRVLNNKLKKRLHQIQEKQGSYFDEMRSKLNAKLDKLNEVIQSNQEKIDEAIRRERKAWRSRMARKLLKKQVSNLQEQLTSLKSGTAQDLPDDLRRSLEKEMARKHHEKLLQERRARRIATKNSVISDSSSFIELEDPSDDLTESEADPSALTRSDDTDTDNDDEDGFAAELPALYNELRSMKSLERSIPSSNAAALDKVERVVGQKALALERGKKHKKKSHHKKHKKKKHKKKKKKHHKKKKKHHKKKKKHHKKKKSKRFAAARAAPTPSESAESSEDGYEYDEGSDEESEAGDYEYDSGAQEAAAQEAAHFAQNNPSGVDLDEAAQEGASKETNYNDVSDLMNPEEEKLWRQFQATPDIGALQHDKDDKGNKGAKGTKNFKDTTMAEDSAKALLSEAQGSDEDVTSALPTQMRQASSREGPSTNAAKLPTSPPPASKDTKAERPADELVGLCFNELINERKNGASSSSTPSAQAPSTSNAATSSAPASSSSGERESPKAQVQAQAQAQSKSNQQPRAPEPRLLQLVSAEQPDPNSFDLDKLLAEASPADFVNLEGLLADFSFMEVDAGVSSQDAANDPKQYCSNVLHNYRQWRLASVCSGNTVCAAQCPATVCKLPPGVSVDKPKPRPAPEAVSPPTWNYAQGGKDWTGLCQSGQQQSPIMIEEGRLNFTTNAREVRGNLYFIQTNYNPAVNLTLTHSDRYTLAIIPQVSGSMGHVFSGHNDDSRWAVTGVFFHAPSEHTFSGRVSSDNPRGGYPMEVQIVHQRTGSNDTLVFVVPFEIKHTPGDNTFLASLKWSHLPRNVHDSTLLTNQVNLASLSYSLGSDFYAYTGSQTTPDCTENVAYRVFTAAQGMTQAQLDSIMSLQNNASEFPNKHGNFRETQPRNQRSIVKYIRHQYFSDTPRHVQRHRDDQHHTFRWITPTTSPCSRGSSC